MNSKTTIYARSHTISMLTAGLIISVVGLGFMAAWMLHIALHFQRSFVSIPMNFNTALSFFLVGTTLIAINSRWLRFAKALSFLIIFIGLMHLIEYIFDIKHLFIKSSEDQTYIYFAQIAPISAFNFLLTGLGLQLISSSKKSEIRYLILYFIGINILSLVIVSLLIYFNHFEFELDWLGATFSYPIPMLFFICIGAIFIKKISNIKIFENKKLILTNMTLNIVIIIVWQVYSQKTHQTLHEEVQLKSQQVANEFSKNMKSNLKLIQRIVKKAEHIEDLHLAWLSLSKESINDLIGFQWITWAGKDFKVKWFWPNKNLQKSIQKNLIIAEKKISNGLSSEKYKNFLYANSAVVSSENELLVNVPLSEKGKFKGLVIVGLNLDRLIDAALTDDLKNNHIVFIYQGKNKIYSHLPISIEFPHQKIEKFSKISLLNLDWTLGLIPNKKFSKNHQSFFLFFILFIGFLLSICVTLMIYFNQKMQKIKRELLDSFINIKRKNVDLNKMEQNLRKANESKTHFLLGVSHEISTRLSGMISMATSLIKSPLDEKQLQSATHITLAGHALLDIFNKILDFAKIDSKTQQQMSLCQMSVFMHQIILFFQLDSDKRKSLIKLTLSQDIPPLILIDSDQLNQLLINLINFQYKLSNEGQIIVSVYDKGQLGQKILIRFEISNQHGSISKNDREIISNFFNKNNYSSQQQQSIVELILCKQLVEKMHGIIGVEDSNEQNFIFWFEIACEISLS